MYILIRFEKAYIVLFSIKYFRKVLIRNLKTKSKGIAIYLWFYKFEYMFKLFAISHIDNQL
jgi:hypothetical protein